MWALLNIRDRTDACAGLVLNRARKIWKPPALQRNIVLKARQLGVTTYVAARFLSTASLAKERSAAGRARPAFR